MNINKLLKKRLVFFCISTVFIVLVTVASSYAFSRSDLNSDAVVLNSSGLKVLYENGQIMEQHASTPMSYQQGLEQTTYNTIKIINQERSSRNYSLMVTSDGSIENNLSYDKIYYSVNGSNPMLLNSSTNGILFYGKINAGEEEILKIKVWPALEYITNDDQGKSVDLRFEVVEN